eukprot:TRINITY_DN14372_c0_g1_i1.p1 TRINITY_DN14372_c0_g1~~TRINITY_DN14372_c0_g1_i1.p1  ORF type:complete len:503 (-),score=203.52 TRINITY_DN14372_c0_g1_i1:33-1508(-)
MAGSVVSSPHTTEKVMVSEEQTKTKQEKKARKRRKGVYRRLVTQMEFYFSDANLRQSKFLLPLYQSDPLITLTTFLTFNKVASMLGEILGEEADQATRVAELTKALSVVESDTVLLSECQTKVGRKTPFTPTLPTQVDSCTMYVENLPTEADHDYLRSFFSSYGEIQYVSLPKFRSGRSKGFAFVEFGSAEVVEKALADFTSVDISNPGELASVRTFNEEKDAMYKDKGRKRKGDDGDNEQSKAKKVKTNDTPPVDSEQCGDAPEEAADMIEGDGLKKEVSDIRVLSKVQWKKLRNNYLNDQRKNFAALKNSLRKPRTPHFRERVEVSDLKDTKDGIKTDDSKENIKLEDSKVVVKTNVAVKEEAKVDIKPGVVVKLIVPGGVDNIQKLKQAVREGLGGEAVAYVDGKVGVEAVFVRCVDKEQASRLAVAEMGEGWKGDVIVGKEEQEYHSKIERDKEEKRSGKVVVKKPKNKTKLIEKAESLKSAHVYFD